jgi:hypothetical protein
LRAFSFLAEEVDFRAGSNAGRGYRTVPDAMRHDVEFAIRREQRALNRVRRTIPMKR